MSEITEKAKKSIVDFLCNDDRVDAANIKVRVDGDVVELTGHVSNEKERELAGLIAQYVSGLGHVQNHIAVVTDPPEDPKAYIA